MSAVESPSVVPFGDGALLVELGDVIDPVVNARIHRLVRLVAQRCAPTEGWGAAVPGYASLLVPYDPSLLDVDEATGHLLRVLAEEQPEPDSAGDLEEAVVLPVRYGGDHGPDLAEVAELCHLRPQDVIELHASTTYLVYLLGFVPGFAYLGELPAALETPRLDTPRPRVPAGSVGVAGRQTAAYPFATPGGWRLIGRTDVVLWDARRVRPSLLEAGQRVRFVPVTGA